MRINTNGGIYEVNMQGWTPHNGKPPEAEVQEFLETLEGKGFQFPGKVTLNPTDLHRLSLGDRRVLYETNIKPITETEK